MASQSQLPVRRFFSEMLNGGNLDVADELFSPDYTLIFPDSPAPLHGPAAIRLVVGIYRSAFPDLHFTIEDEFATADRAAVRWTVRGTQRGELLGIPPTGRSATWTGISIFRVVDGRIVEDKVEEDRVGLMQQLGVLPAPASAVA